MTITKNIAKERLPEEIEKTEITSETLCKFINCKPAQELADSFSNLFSIELLKQLKEQIINVEKTIGLYKYVPARYAVGVALYTLHTDSYTQEEVAMMFQLQIDRFRKYIKKYRIEKRDLEKRTGHSGARILRRVSDSQIENREFQQNQDTENRKLNLPNTNQKKK